MTVSLHRSITKFSAYSRSHPLGRRSCTGAAQDCKIDSGTDEIPHLFRENRMSVIAFLQKFKLAWDASGIHKGAAIWIFKHFFTDPAEASVKERVLLMSYANVNHDGVQISYSAIVEYLLKRCVKDYNIAKLNSELRDLGKRSMILAWYEKDWRSKTLRCGSAYDE